MKSKHNKFCWSQIFIFGVFFLFLCFFFANKIFSGIYYLFVQSSLLQFSSSQGRSKIFSWCVEIVEIFPRENGKALKCCLLFFHVISKFWLYVFSYKFRKRVSFFYDFFLVRWRESIDFLPVDASVSWSSFQRRKGN